MTLIQSAVLGLVQGLTEFIPVSSTAHLRLVPYLLGWEDPGVAFSAVIQLGTLASVFLYFRKDIKTLVFAGLGSLWRRNPLESEDSRIAWAILCGNIPIVVLGLAFKDFIETEARGLKIIGLALIIFGALLYMVDRWALQQKTLRQLKFWQIQIIGLFQALALVPGCSRSGSTLTGGLLLGLERKHAAHFSFLLGLPAIGASGLFQLIAIIHPKEPLAFSPLALGMATIVSFVSGYLSIGFLLSYLKHHSTFYFAVYRILLGCMILFLI